SLGISTREVRLPQDLIGLDGIIFPGGESTTMANLMDVFALRKPLFDKISQGLPVWGTCAGMILLAKKLVQDRPDPLGLMDITVSRNAFGRQIDSFETELSITGLEKPMHATFIRAPLIVSAGKGVEILAKLEDGTIVAARQKNMLVTSFHPELTKDTRLHEFFIDMSARE
ncbi:MAG TPA: pyridoxal 5'-phosphate synthase glutaminase subunit PdxT, partial [Patescibacteria group bacterium]|nr:pyridoxal 5'-phosphate synthase glutaminase subunit PdxT [Patescibacteria group bacterium]